MVLNDPSWTQTTRLPGAAPHPLSYLSEISPTDTPSTLHFSHSHFLENQIKSSGCGCCTNIYSFRYPLSIKNQFHGGTTGSPNRDPQCSANTKPLKTRNPGKDCMTQMFISSLLICLLCFQYNLTSYISSYKYPTPQTFHFLYTHIFSEH